MMAVWTRDTPWRQGHVLSQAASDALGLIHPCDADVTCAVVISHDCDLANDDLDIEPHAEIIVGRRLLQGNGNYFWAKSPRVLHLEVLSNDDKVIVELIATDKCFVLKRDLAAFDPDPAFSFPGKSLNALRAWLSVRYNRAAFADGFVSRLSKSKVDKGIAKLIEPVGKLLSAVYFDVDRGRDIDRSDGSAYELKVVLMYPAGDDPEQTSDIIEKLETSIESLFSKKFFDPKTDKWNEIALMSCMSISEDDITVAKSKQLVEWRLEHMTLRAEDNV